MARNTVIRSMHDIGIAAWFGGTLANAVALNAAASKAHSDKAAAQVTNAGWDRWTPVNAAAIGAHIVGATGLLLNNRDRVATQKGVGTMSVAKTALTGAALGLTGYSRILGRKISAREDVPVTSGTEPTIGTPPEVADAQRKLHLLQWVVPAVTGSLVIISSLAGEQQKPSEVKKGIRGRLSSNGAQTKPTGAKRALRGRVVATS